MNTFWFPNAFQEGNCKVKTQSSMECSLPRAPIPVRNEMQENGRRRRRSTFDGRITAKLQIKMDGYAREFELKYYKDPSFVQISKPVLKTENVKLTLTVRNCDISDLTCFSFPAYRHFCSR